jgi:GT2 family glycosyltransferase
LDLSFVILTWNSARYVEKCLSDIDRALEGAGLSYEILVLDNGSGDGTQAILGRLAAASGGRIVACYEPVNTGTTRSRNRLLALAKGRFVCVMDSDVEFPAGVIEALLALLSSDEGIGVVVPRIFYPSGAWQKSFDRFPTLFDKINRFFRLRAIEASEGRRQAGARQPAHVDYAISAFWLMRRDLLRTVGLLDERIFYAPEDVDFCLRVWKAGLRIVYVPTVSIVHHTQEISRGFKLNKAKLVHLQGLVYYFMKHRYLWRRPSFAAQCTEAISGASAPRASQKGQAS